MPNIDWDAIFERRPELRPPGYEEAAERAKAMKDDDPNAAIKKRLQEIHKEKISEKNRARNKNKKR